MAIIQARKGIIGVCVLLGFYGNSAGAGGWGVRPRESEKVGVTVETGV